MHAHKRCRSLKYGCGSALCDFGRVVRMIYDGVVQLLWNGLRRYTSDGSAYRIALTECQNYLRGRNGVDSIPQSYVLACESNRFLNLNFPQQLAKLLFIQRFLAHERLRKLKQLGQLGAQHFQRRTIALLQQRSHFDARRYAQR